MMVDERHITPMIQDDSKVQPMMEPPLTQEQKWIKDILDKTREFDASRDLLVVPASVQASLSDIPTIALPDVRNVAKVRVGYR